MKRVLPLLVFLLAIPSAQAITTYDITVQEQGVLVNVTFELYASSAGEKVNYWSTSFIIPEGAQVLGVWDSKGPIANYSLLGTTIFLDTHTGGLRDREVVTILYHLNNRVDRTFFPLQRLNLSLAAFTDSRTDVPDEKTFVTVTAPDIIAYTPSFGFTSQEGDGQVLFAGEGPGGFSLFFGQGQEYDNFVVFGEDIDVTEADLAYGLIAVITGLVTEYDRHPVVILDDEDYDRELNDWSSGQFREGLIFLRSSDENLMSTLLHEATHGVNERALRWQKTHVSWFDEGVAKYVEFVLARQQEKRQAELFGEPVVWREGTTQYTLNPRGTADELWNYYRSGNTWMEQWAPDQPQAREFGYAYSELVIRDAIFRRGSEAIHRVMEELLEERVQAETVDEYNIVIFRALGSNFRPCDNPSRDVFEACLDDLNALDPPVPDTVVIHGEEQVIVIPEIIQPEEEPVHVSIFTRIIDALTGAVEAIRGFLGI